MELYHGNNTDTTAYNFSTVDILENQVIQIETKANNYQESSAQTKPGLEKKIVYSFQSFGYEGLLDNLSLVVTYTNRACQPVIQVFKIKDKKAFVLLDGAQMLPNSGITLNVRNTQEKNIKISVSQSDSVPTELLELPVNELINLRVIVTGNNFNSPSLDPSIGWMSFNTQNILY